MNSVETRPEAFEWKIKFPEGAVWTVVETGKVFKAESSELDDLRATGMDILTFLRRAMASGGCILTVKAIGPM